ncbi:YihY/virulence factor BrkB family protein [Calidifontibacter sp. DB0510]|uniref:YihY/virulence factor BrkB family protein n=1 Tax=Metallococcus carri TaxID=1656884 RepID=A0A967B2V9_9MICO|nr:YihY/virulence factor BrkB family protein [Metallococcus carri]NOP36519.1 YihY/virulence factor BrkB family protein [Calidifontibacter sp. DB2511S]
MDRLQQRFPPLGFPIAVIYKYADDQAAYLAALLTYYAFVSLFPLLLLATTVLAFVLQGHPQWQEQLLNSALAEFPVVGDQLRTPDRLGGGIGGITVGVLGALYGGLGVAQAFQYAANTVWQVPRNNRPNPFKARGKSFILLCALGIGLIATTVVSSFVSGLASGGWYHLGWFVGTSIVVGLVFLFAFEIATARKQGFRTLWVGSLIAGVGWSLLQTFGAGYVTRVVRHASAMNGVFAFVLGMLAFIYLASVVVVFAMEIDVVRVRHLYPRALLTPFTDDVTLTDADRKSYAGQAKAQRFKGFEDIDVTFDEDARTRAIPSKDEPTTDDLRRSDP